MGSRANNKQEIVAKYFFAVIENARRKFNNLKKRYEDYLQEVAEEQPEGEADGEVTEEEVAEEQTEAEDTQDSAKEEQPEVVAKEETVNPFAAELSEAEKEDEELKSEEMLAA